ncbi:MAG: COQ9 family protein, partial [Pseudomonadota bacterium]
MGDQNHTTDEDLRQAILDDLLGEAAFEGFTRSSLSSAAKSADVTGADLERLFPRGVSDALRFWSEAEDRAMAEAFEALNPQPHGITAKITWLVKQRIETLDWNREAARRAAATLALPAYGALGGQLAWKTADSMWRAIGDPSTDFNFYTKRMSLSVIYTATLTRWFADQNATGEEPYKDTWAFLDARIGHLMQ